MVRRNLSGNADGIVGRGMGFFLRTPGPSRVAPDGISGAGARRVAGRAGLDAGRPGVAGGTRGLSGAAGDVAAGARMVHGVGRVRRAGAVDRLDATGRLHRRAGGWRDPGCADVRWLGPAGERGAFRTGTLAALVARGGVDEPRVLRDRIFSFTHGNAAGGEPPADRFGLVGCGRIDDHGHAGAHRLAERAGTRKGDRSARRDGPVGGEPVSTGDCLWTESLVCRG